MSKKKNLLLVTLVSAGMAYLAQALLLTMIVPTEDFATTKAPSKTITAEVAHIIASLN